MQRQGHPTWKMLQVHLPPANIFLLSVRRFWRTEFLRHGHSGIPSELCVVANGHTNSQVLLAAGEEDPPLAQTKKDGLSACKWHGDQEKI